MTPEWKVGVTVLHVAKPAKFLFEASLAASRVTTASITHKVCKDAWEFCCLGQELKNPFCIDVAGADLVEDAYMCLPCSTSSSLFSTAARASCAGLCFAPAPGRVAPGCAR